MAPLSPINIGIAFAAGFLTFFAGCLAPIVPVYISFLAGATSKDLNNPSASLRAKTFKNSVFFVSGFIGMFILLGLTVNTLAKSLAQYQTLLTQVGGVIMLLFGIHLSGLLKFKFVYQERKLGAGRLQSGSAASSFALGGIFGFSWTPCIGPVLAAILFWAGSQETLSAAIVLMLVFSIGLAIPFLAIGFFFDKLIGKLKFFNRYAPKMQMVSGIILIVFGLLLISGQFVVISGFLLNHLGSAAFVVELQQ